MTNNDRQILKNDNWHKAHHVQCKQITSVFIEQVEMRPSRYYTGLKYPCDYGTDNYNPI
jgi:hypothetical protein